jgi:hypothetical protein
MAGPRITSVRFVRYKAFREFSISFEHFNVLVGPNNSGKSTILGAFRILAEAMRRARTRNPTIVVGPHGATRGYEINLANVPVATENIFHNYIDDQAASVSFRFSSGDQLVLYFPAIGVCDLVCETSGRSVTSTAGFKKHFDFEVGFVPILGPLEHDEPLYLKEAARDALITPRASRNFRNIWYHYPDNFDKFRELVQATWPGMDVQMPEVDRSHDKPLLRMFCPEKRIAREIVWAGFGFQVWCQMLTFMVANRDSSIFIVDEPDIYLHSNLQRQLISSLRDLGPDIILATHSPDMLSEAEPHEVLTIVKEARSAKRIGSPDQLRAVFSDLGSSLTPVLTQAVRTKKLLFVEGKDYQVIARFAKKLGARRVATRSDFAVVPAEGFNHVRARAFKDGVEASVGSPVLAALVFDRDYRADDEVSQELSQMQSFCWYAHIHRRKELENFVLVVGALQRAISLRVLERNRRTGENMVFASDVRAELMRITEEMKHDVQAQYLRRQQAFARFQGTMVDNSTILIPLLAQFDQEWQELEKRLLLVNGKKVLSRLNEEFQKKWKASVTVSSVIDAMQVSEIPAEMRGIIEKLEDFASLDSEATD